MKCEHCGKNEVTEICEWGVYEYGKEPRTEPMNDAWLCDGCSSILWNKIKGAVNAGLIHFIIRTSCNHMR